MAQLGTMQELEFAELDENGRLVVVAEDGTRYAVPVDDRLRAALRRRPREGAADGGDFATATPREIQAMIRAGQTAEDVASSTGWELARVRRFEGPVLAEREHVVGLAKAAHVRAQGRTDGSHTLERRVRERLQSRGVPPSDTRWDAARTGSQGPWTVVVAFTAGGRERQATWHYEVQDRSIDALDDEARWLSEDEQALPGGLAGHPLLGTSHAEDETADLMATMRERRQARIRRGRRPEPRTEERAKQAGGIDNEPLPLENLPYDPETMGDPPAAHPRGSAPEAPHPVGPVETGAEGEAESEAEAEARPGSPRARRERRRLRMPKLPPVLGEPTEEEAAGDAEISYARTHDPQEVSFDEFFGTDDEVVDASDRSGQGVPGVAGSAEDVPEVWEDDALDVGQDELVDEGEQIVIPAAGAPVAPAAAASTGDKPDATEVEGDGEDDAAESPTTSKRKGRTSVPSWDDIMFGGGGDRRRG